MPDEYSYFCPFCEAVTEWHNLPDREGKKGRSQCQGCQVVGSNTFRKCKGCREKQYVFFGTKQKQCFKCAQGFGPKSVTGLAVSKCMFCKDEMQTWYVFEAKGKMKCTNCEALMPSRTPLVPEYCPSCFELKEEGLLTSKGVTKCLKCFMEEVKASRVKQTDKVQEVTE